ncbi:MAG: PilT/PilU family type 4a pilus ATPase [Phycisphaerae bacterium]|jgi:twitching motility protein PilT
MEGSQIGQYIAAARSKNASDVHVVAGAPVLFRIGKQLVPGGKDKLTPEMSEELVFGLLNPAQQKLFMERLDFDLMAADSSGRYRVNISYNDGAVGAVIRILPEEPRSLDELRLPPVVKYLASMTKGIVLITGSTSQGKTTTMSAMISEINTYQRKHIITIEDPIETVHSNKKGIVRQREVGRDTKSFAAGLRAALRQDPDVIAIGEMRDYETIRIALTAAETGVLVLSTLHVISIDKMIERLLSYAPPEEENHVRYLLAGALQGVIHQELVPAINGGKRVAMEVLVATDAAKNVIRNRGSFFLRNIIATGSKYGMLTMSQSITALLEEKAITAEVAENVMANYSQA